MKKRPLVLWVIALALMASPLYYYVEKARLDHIGLGEPGAIFGAMSTIKLIGVVLGPIVGWLVLTVRPISWYAIIVFSVYTLVANTTLLVEGRMRFWVYLLNVPTALFVILYFVRREVMSPYFNPRLRWWESDRLDVKAKAEIVVEGEDAVVAETLNISPTGAFLVTETPPPVGTEFDVSITIGKESIKARASSVWTSDGKQRPRGTGARFDAPSSKLIKAALANVQPRRQPRHAFRLEVDIEGRDSVTCKTFDVNDAGCFLVTDAKFRVGEKLAMTLHMIDSPVQVEGEVVWVSDGKGGRPPGIGIRFARSTPELRAQLGSLIAREGTPAPSVPPPPKDADADAGEGEG
jgi:hypothetical protein